MYVFYIHLQETLMVLQSLGAPREDGPSVRAVRAQAPADKECVTDLT